MNTEKIIGTALAVMVAAAMTFAAGPAASGPAPQTKQCLSTCQEMNKDGAAININQCMVHCEKQMNGNKDNPATMPQVPTKKRPADGVDWDKVFGQVG